MRQYRGKRKDNRKWVYGYPVEFEDMTIIFECGESTLICKSSCKPLSYISSDFWVEVDPATVGQYTGLKDKNGKGKKAYGGDKVLWDWNKVHKNIEGVIEWDDERLAFVITNWYFQNNKKVLLANHPEIEIIGSIHDEEKK